MDNRTKKIYILIKENKALAVETNLKDFVNVLPEHIAGIRQYHYYYKKFKESNYFIFEFNKDYIFQRVDFL